VSASGADRFGETWVYESIVGAVPGISLSPRIAVIVQFVGFEAVLLGLATVYDLWSAVPAGSVAILVAAVGSAFMHDIGQRVRRSGAPPAYRRMLFGSSIEVALGVFAYAALLTYLFVVDPREGGETLLASLLGPSPPALAVYFLLVVCWDVTYRIGTGWWAAVVALWRARRLALDPAAHRSLRAVDRRTVGFALVQTALLPFLAEYPILALAVGGHVLAVLVVVGTAHLLGRRP
jgi:hypothetical protein